MNDLPLRPAADIGVVEDRFFTLRDFPLTDGTVMPEATIAYETYGRPTPPNGPNGGRNAILCTHGYTASHHFAGRNPANGNQPDSWDGLIGPGKVSVCCAASGKTAPRACVPSAEANPATIGYL